MTKSPKLAPLAVRFEANEMAALKRAAQSDRRALSALVRNITGDWLRQKGWLGDGMKD